MDYSVPTLALDPGAPGMIRFDSEAGASYQVEWSPGLESWFHLGGIRPGTGAEIEVSDNVADTPLRFYRVRLVE